MLGDGQSCHLTKGGDGDDDEPCCLSPWACGVRFLCVGTFPPDIVQHR